MGQSDWKVVEDGDGLLQQAGVGATVRFCSNENVGFEGESDRE